jgi:hypothetical protein
MPKPILSAVARKRIQTLKRAGKRFGALAVANVNHVELSEADDLLVHFSRTYAKWLQRLSRECLDLARTTEAAATAATTVAAIAIVEQSFGRQFLRLQQNMQHENRSYTAISNIMKTKHDTVKNSISNVR